MAGLTPEQKKARKAERKKVLSRLGIDSVAKGYFDTAQTYNLRMAEQIPRIDDVITAPMAMNTDITEDMLNRVYYDLVSNSPVASMKDFYNQGLGLGNNIPLNPPFQFGLLDDVRLPFADTPSPFSLGAYNALGRVYADNIKQNFQVVDFQMGMDVYNMNMGNFFGADSSGDVAAYLRGGEGNVVGEMLKTTVLSMAAIAQVAFDTVTLGLFKKKFVDFKERMNLYFEYVNDLLFEMAYSMGLTKQDNLMSKTNSDGKAVTEVNAPPPNSDGKSFEYESGSNALKGKFSIQAMMGRPEQLDINNKLRYIRFILNKGISVSETWSNMTEEHPLMSSMNEAAQAADAAGTTNGVSANPYADPMSIIKGMGTNAVNKNITVSMGALGAVAAGRGRMVLPNVWSNSNFSRSYTLTFKFYSPYGDKFSIFENCYVPMICMLAMSTPRQIGKISFMSPFIIRAYAPGLFACNFGIVESMTITKGDDKNERTIDGLSKVITVSLNIKDLIPEFTMTMGRGILGTLHSENVQLLDWMWILGGQSLEFKERFGGKIDKFIERTRLGISRVQSGEWAMNLFQKVPGVGAFQTVSQKIDNAFNWDKKNPKLRSMDNGKVDLNGGNDSESGF